MKTIQYEVPVGSRLTRRFYCPVLKKQISLTEDFTEDNIVFGSQQLSGVDSGLNFSIFRFIVTPEIMIPKKYDIHYSVSAEYINIMKGGE
tara:strand:+ start:351 stop:620 length:270 start_codon:yes stop_codon:yes gene_type:complete